ncbi:MAG: bifunctional precorrin-2 dehydrogenase/sirohydrochlorin ferrochelatase [Ammonifex sp.]|jgi:precorrin-2 dehydrogenase/sirohydrochlorin ferrochelatase|nr:MAG: bifunctional precorrin-2 dehydrogenase/sirohydrochlorin ferrochelatase [Ammonifex sp.]
MLYPAFIKLQGASCTVIGGGKVAARKVGMLLECGARVKVISPEVVEELDAWARADVIQWVERGFAKGDTEGSFMVISATDDREVNAAVARECVARNILLNVVDQPEFCSFYVPSVIRRGPLTIAVSTGGKSPLLARKMREKLEAAVPPAFGEFVEYLGAVREKVIAEHPELKGELLELLVDREVLAFVEQNDFDKAKELVDSVLNRYRS